jgi:hypothetical protein
MDLQKMIRKKLCAHRLWSLACRAVKYADNPEALEDYILESKNVNVDLYGWKFLELVNILAVLQMQRPLAWSFFRSIWKTFFGEGILEDKDGYTRRFGDYIARVYKRQTTSTVFLTHAFNIHLVDEFILEYENGDPQSRAHHEKIAGLFGYNKDAIHFFVENQLAFHE